jgi:hypothetical protein
VRLSSDVELLLIAACGLLLALCGLAALVLAGEALRVAHLVGIG